MKLTLHVWRQNGPEAKGGFARYDVDDVSPDMSFLEMMDVLNDRLESKGEPPIAFEHDCREGICGACSMVINGQAHGPQKNTTTCQLHMRSFKEGDEIYIEPWRAEALPVVKDLVVDRSALDRIIQAGGVVSVRTGSAPEANTIPVPKDDLERSMDAAECIGCGACVAACPNGSAMLLTAAKIAHLGTLPQGQPERHIRAVTMVERMDEEGFGGCTNHGECQEACPKGISIQFISQMNGDYIFSNLLNWKRPRGKMKAQ